MISNYLKCENKASLIGNLCFFVLTFVLYANKESLEFPVHDFLDGIVPVFKYLSETPFSISGITLERYMYGIDSGLIGYPAISPEVLWHRLIPSTSLALLFSEIFIRYVGFIGFLSLTNQVFAPSNFLRVSYALVFAFLPIYPSVLYTIMVQPYFITLMFKLYNSQIKRKDFFITFFVGIVSIPTYSILLFSAFLIITTSVLLKFIKWSKENISIILLFLTSHFISFASTYKVFFQGDHFHREEFKIITDLALSSKIENYLKVIAFGDYHFNTNLYLFLPIIFLQYFVKTKSKSESGIVQLQKIVLFLFFIVLLIFVIGTEFYNTMIKIMPLQQDLRYVISILPLIGIFFAYLSSITIYLSSKFISYKHLVITPFICISIFGFYLFPWNKNFPTYRFQNITKTSTIEKYYNYELLSDTAFITSPSKKMLSYGIDPMIALYNGQYTADGYASKYRLEYKEKFRSIISDNLESDIFQLKYFDNWGSRVYLIGNPDTLNFCAARKINVDFVVSTQEIKSSDLIYVKYLDRLFLYQLNC